MTAVLAPELAPAPGHPLEAVTVEGVELVAAAEQLAVLLAERAAEHDRDATYPFEAIELLREARFFAAPVPAVLGGGGVQSVHDLVVASSRLARGDASVAIGLNMHLTVLLNLVRRYEMAAAAGDERRVAAFAASLEPFARQDVVLAAAVSERGQHLTRPATRASRVPEGWRIDGAKVFCTMAPAATHLLVALAYEDERGRELYGFAQVPADAPGVTVAGDWDALGMRASGSHSVRLDGVVLPASAVRGGFPCGDALPYMERNLTAGLFHASASLGIAESAHALATAAFAARGGRADDGFACLRAAESAVELSACRAVLARAASLVDAHVEANPEALGADAEIAALFVEAQGAKAFVNEAAQRIVDRALALSGGAGYLAGHPLARAYRDVRAGAFMHPLGANRAYDLVGRTALGLAPELA